MAGTFLSRARRLVASGAEELLAAAERASADALKREAVREMRAAIESARTQHARAVAIVERAQRRIVELEADATARGEDARYALGRDRSDLAEQAVACQLDAEAEIERERGRIAHAKAEGEALVAALGELEERGEAMAGGSIAARTAPTYPIDPEIVRRADDAEAALAHATALTGIAPAVWAIDELRRGQEIAARLAALQSAKPKSSRRARD